MKVKDLLERLEKANPDDDVVFAVRGIHTLVGATASVTVDNAYTGFDWDNGRFIISTKQPVIKLSNEDYSNFINEQKMCESEALSQCVKLSFSRLKNKVLKE